MHCSKKQVTKLTNHSTFLLAQEKIKQHYHFILFSCRINCISYSHLCDLLMIVNILIDIRFSQNAISMYLSMYLAYKFLEIFSKRWDMMQSSEIYFFAWQKMQANNINS